MTIEGISESLLRVRPPRIGEQSLKEFENILESLGEGHITSLEVSSGGSVLDLLVRTAYPDRVVAAIASHYPGAEVDDVTGIHDPLEVTEGQTLWRKILRSVGDDYLPLKVYDDERPLALADPFVDVLGSMSIQLQRDERLVSRLVLKQMSHGWSEKWRSRAMSGAGGHNQAAVETERRTQQETAYQQRRQDTVNRNSEATASLEMPFGHELIMVLAAVLALLLLGVWLKQIYDAGEFVRVALYGAGALLIVAAAAVGALKFGLFRKGVQQQFHDPQQVEKRISGGAFEAEIQVMAIIPATGAEASEQAEDLLEGIINAYRGFDNPLGSRLAVEELRQVVKRHPDQKVDASVDVVDERWLTFADENRRFGPFAKRPVRGIIGVRETAALWHPPGESAALGGLRRSQNMRLAPPSVATSRDGTLVGTSRLQGGGKQFIRLPPDVTTQNIFMVARTGAGKSTGMAHIAGEAMLQKSMGRNSNALVVVDPHGDLIDDVLSRVPAVLMNRVVLIDLGMQDRVIGINLLDLQVFEDRDTTAEGIIEVLRGGWDAVGPRMEAIIRTSMQTMYEANRKLPRRRQLTMLDAVPLLSNRDFRNAVLDLVDDPHLLAWWRDSFGAWSDRTYGVEALAPVVTRLTTFSNLQAVRGIVGQSRCTIDLRAAIERGDIVLVNTSQSSVGTLVSSLVGVSMMKLVDLIIRKQGEIHESEDVTRRRVQLIVDEVQNFTGVDVESMLAELRKFGCSLVLATQSLSRLNEQSPTMRDSILANSAALIVFQVSAVDAHTILPELRSEYLTEADITGQPVHHAYVRLISDGEVQPTFSTEFMPPFEEDLAVHHLVTEGAYAYSRDWDEVLAELAAQADDIEGRIEYLREVFRRLKDSQEGNGDESSRARR